MPPSSPLCLCSRFSCCLSSPRRFSTPPGSLSLAENKKLNIRINDHYFMTVVVALNNTQGFLGVIAPGVN